MPNLNSTFSISPHNKIPIYYRSPTPPPTPMNKTWYEKKSRDQILPHQRKGNLLHMPFLLLQKFTLPGSMLLCAREKNPYWRQTQKKKKICGEKRGISWQMESVSTSPLIFSAELKLQKYTAVINSWKCQHVWRGQRFEVHIRKPTEFMPCSVSWDDGMTEK